MWDANTGKELFALPDFSGSVRRVAFSPDGALIVTVNEDKVADKSLDKVVKVWDAMTGALLISFPDFAMSVLAVTFSPDGKYVLTASADNTVKVWEAELPPAPAK